MASRGVALLNRLRLGEAPNAADAALAARLVHVEAILADVLDVAEDLQQTALGDAGSRRLRARLALLVEMASALEAATVGAVAALARWFSLRAEVEGDADGDGPEADAEASTATSAGSSSGIRGALADLAVPARVGEAIDVGVAGLLGAGRPFQSGLATLLDTDPDTEATLDFLSTAEVLLGHLLHAVLRPEFVEGETPYRSGLAHLAAASLEGR